jgi:S-adenosylmethionine/arginine decarboxylase-like enzyme
MYGKHVKFIFDAYVSQDFESTEKVQELLTKATSSAGMRPLGTPVIYNVPLQIKKMGSEPYEDEGGVTGVLVLSTSHCAIHTWPLQNKAVMDLYSCRDYRTEDITTVIADIYAPRKIHTTDLSHSLTLPEQL